MKARAPLVTGRGSAVVVVVRMEAMEGEGFTLKKFRWLVVSPSPSPPLPGHAEGEQVKVSQRCSVDRTNDDAMSKIGTGHGGDEVWQGEIRPQVS